MHLSARSTNWSSSDRTSVARYVSPLNALNLPANELVPSWPYVSIIMIEAILLWRLSWVRTRRNKLKWLLTAWYRNRNLSENGWVGAWAFVLHSSEFVHGEQRSRIQGISVMDFVSFSSDRRMANSRTSNPNLAYKYNDKLTLMRLIKKHLQLVEHDGVWPIGVLQGPPF